MESIVRNVKDIEADDRRSLEHVVGQQLQDNQQIVIQVMTVASQDELSDTYAAAQMESAMRAGWDDPAMDDYNEYDKHRPS